eukprot:636026-Amphidinium_carterae.1
MTLQMQMPEFHEHRHQNSQISLNLAAVNQKISAIGSHDCHSFHGFERVIRNMKGTVAFVYISSALACLLECLRSCATCALGPYEGRLYAIGPKLHGFSSQWAVELAKECRGRRTTKCGHRTSSIKLLTNQMHMSRNLIAKSTPSDISSNFCMFVEELETLVG